MLGQGTMAQVIAPRSNANITDVRFVPPREDIAWENDRIAFRVYGPALVAEVSNGVDVWSKRVRYPIIASWYAGDTATGPAKRSYHVDHGQGADFFGVGRTLGCGGSAIWTGDSLLQPGVFESYRIITTGPTRAQFELTYRPVVFKGRPVRETRRITLDAGQHLNQVEVTYRADGTPFMIPFAVGLVKRKNVAAARNEADHWISLFGPTNDDAANGALGMGAILPGASFKRISEDKTHIFLHGEVQSGEVVTYYAGAGWTRSGFVADEAGWQAHLETRAQELER
jgi:pectinesterase